MHPPVDVVAVDGGLVGAACADELGRDRLLTFHLATFAPSAKR